MWGEEKTQDTRYQKKKKTEKEGRGNRNAPLTEREIKKASERGLGGQQSPCEKKAGNIIPSLQNYRKEKEA